MKLIFNFLLSSLPPKISIQLRYYYNFHKFVNFRNPLTFTEKIQWLKIYNRAPKYITLVDKYAVKQYVANVIGGEFIIPTLGVWDSPDLIEWDKLPEKFVLKTTHAGGSTGVIICKDIHYFDRAEAIRKLKKSLQNDSYAISKEWPYKNVLRRIIAEKFIEIPGKDDLTDYKIFCFNGDPRYVQVIQDRNTNETIDFFDTNWNHQEFYGLNPIAKPANHPIAKPANHPIAKPANLDEMLRIAKMLSKDTVFVRVDLYNTAGKIYFGELTFYPASGMGHFTPEKYDRILGGMIQLPKRY